MKKVLVFMLAITTASLFSVSAVAELRGDFDRDGDVDAEDLKVFSQNFGKSVNCTNTTDCAPDQFCEKAEGDCEGAGICAPRPQVCPLLWDPVCGCDGKTYANACDAAAAGVSVDDQGECDQRCSGNEKCGSSEYCAKAQGDCSGEGQCVPRPEICLDLWDPVCGCDGKTYSNACYAARTGVNVDYPGVCTSSCESNAECGSSDFCKKAEGECDAQGECAPRPNACYDLWAPVCGCDGNTYSNDCDAAAAGVSVDYRGECAKVCTVNADCAGAHFCRKKTGDCNGKGECAPRPDVCPDLWAPVCGCDGKTYGNACEAHRAGVSIAREGECRSEECDDGSPLLCDMMPPQCTDHELLAIQKNCWVCVNPATCLPWGEPGCSETVDCPPGMICDPCGTSSCPMCDDCVAACVETQAR